MKKYLIVVSAVSGYMVILSEDIPLGSVSPFHIVAEHDTLSEAQIKCKAAQEHEKLLRPAYLQAVDNMERIRIWMAQEVEKKAQP